MSEQNTLNTQSSKRNGINFRSSCYFLSDENIVILSAQTIYLPHPACRIKINPQYEDKKVHIEVENESELKEPEIIIEPKIVEE